MSARHSSLASLCFTILWLSSHAGKKASAGPCLLLLPSYATCKKLAFLVTAYESLGSDSNLPAEVWLHSLWMREGRTLWLNVLQRLHTMRGCFPKATTGHCCLSQWGINTRHSESRVAPLPPGRMCHLQRKQKWSIIFQTEGLPHLSCWICWIITTKIAYSDVPSKPLLFMVTFANR